LKFCEINQGGCKDYYFFPIFQNLFSFFEKEKEYGIENITLRMFLNTHYSIKK